VRPAMPRGPGAIRRRREGRFALAAGGAPGGATIVGINPASPGVAIAGAAGRPLVLVGRGRTRAPSEATRSCGIAGRCGLSRLQGVLAVPWRTGPAAAEQSGACGLSRSQVDVQVQVACDAEDVPLHQSQRLFGVEAGPAHTFCKSVLAKHLRLVARCPLKRKSLITKDLRNPCAGPGR
jgi:hypothetical protein